MKKALKAILGNTATGGVVRAGVAYLAGWLSSRGYNIGVGPDELAGAVLVAITVVNSVWTKKPAKK